MCSESRLAAVPRSGQLPCWMWPGSSVVEQRTHNPSRPGSNPGRAMEKAWYEGFWSIGDVCQVRNMSPMCPRIFRLPDGRQVQKRIGPAWTERGRRPATSPSAWPRIGCGARSTRSGAGRCQGWCAVARPSPMRPPSTCGTSPRTGAGRPRRSATTARSSRSTCCRRAPQQLRWPDLDVDLAVHSIEHPEHYPLTSKH